MKKRLIFINVVVLISVLIGFNCHNNRADKLYNNKKTDQRIISFFTKKHRPILKCQVEECLDSELIVEVIATGNYEYAKENLIQEVKIVKAIKGEISSKLKGKTAYVVGNGWDEGEGQVSTGFVNYMKKGDHYILFADSIVRENQYNSNVIVLAEFGCMRYLNISNDYSVVYDTEDATIEYGKVKESEFFSNDEKTLKMMLEKKHEILSELNIFMEESPGA